MVRERLFGQAGAEPQVGQQFEPLQVGVGLPVELFDHVGRGAGEHRVVGVRPFVADVLVEALHDSVLEGSAEPASVGTVADLQIDGDGLAVRFLDCAEDVQVARRGRIRGDANRAERAGFFEGQLQLVREPVGLGPAQLRPYSRFGVHLGFFGQPRVEDRHDDVEPGFRTYGRGPFERRGAFRRGRRRRSDDRTRPPHPRVGCAARKHERHARPIHRDPLQYSVVAHSCVFGSPDFSGKPL